MAPKLLIGRDLPEDVIQVLIAQLPIEELFQWYKVNKELRESMTKNGPLWETALSRVGWLHPPPPRPDDLTSFQYARLLCSKICSVCGWKPDHLMRLWELRVTMCVECSPSALVRPESWHAAFIPTIITGPKKYRGRTLRVQYDAFLKKLDELHANPTGREAFKGARRVEKAAIESSAKELCDWQKEIAATRREIMEAKKAAHEEVKRRCNEARQAQIYERLRQMDLGMDAERFSQQIGEHVVFQGHSPLSAKDEGNLQDLVAKIVILRDRDALDRDRRLQLLSSVIRESSSGRFPIPTRPLPQIAEDLRCFPELHELETAPLATDNTVIQVMRNRAVRALRNSSSFDDWYYTERLLPAYQTAISSFTSYFWPSWVQGRYPPPKEMVRILCLAVTVFIRDPDGVRNPDDVPVVHYPFIVYPEWRSQPFVFDAYTSANLFWLVRSCGFDPQVTSWVKMHELDARYVCLTCIDREASSAATVFSWWAIVQHIVEHALKSQRDDGIPEYLQCVPISRALRAYIPGPHPCALIWYRCQMCYVNSGDDASFDNEGEIIEHCALSHGVAPGSVKEIHHYTTLSSPPTSKIGHLAGTRSKVIVSGVHLLRDVAPLLIGRDVTIVDNAQVKLQAFFESQILQKMALCHPH